MAPRLTGLAEPAVLEAAATDLLHGVASALAELRAGGAGLRAPTR
ncbi:hypothetical protein ACLQ24_18025 [Micromonospora sp. DT4]